MNELLLDGCTPEPLGAYLKALGVLRLVAEQRADPAVLGHWAADAFVLTTALPADDLVAFFLDRYRPAPLVAPWNGGSGFDGRDAGIGDILRSTTSRLDEYREAIRAGRRLVESKEWATWDKRTRL